VKGYSANCSTSSSTVTPAQGTAAAPEMTHVLGAKVPGTSAAPTSATAGMTAGAAGATAGAAGASATAQQTAGGVLGAQATLRHPAKAKSAGGVLGAVARLGVAGARANLPFTGLQLWIAMLIGLGLIGGGLAVRVRATAR
jgi:hypothetical protein